jgi:hypothetical protein
MSKRPSPSRKAAANQVSSATGKPSHENASGFRAKTIETASKRLAKSNDPAFMKFTTYIRKTTHLAVKTRLVSKEKELSDLVEELLFNWLKKNDSFTM